MEQLGADEGRGGTTNSGVPVSDFRWPSAPVDSLGKLREALAECGVPQRNCVFSVLGDTVAMYESTVLSLGVKFPKDDREAANESHRALVRFLAGALYVRLATLEPGKRWVWRVMPEIDEMGIYLYQDPQNNVVDPDIYEGDAADLTMIDTGQRAAQAYARFWTEDA